MAKYRVYYNSSKLAPEKKGYLFNYKPRESSLQREVLEVLAFESEDPQVKE